jgi:hypothetical protein
LDEELVGIAAAMATAFLFTDFVGAQDNGAHERDLGLRACDKATAQKR